MAVVTSISTSKADLPEFKSDLNEFRQMLAQYGLSQNLSEHIRDLVRGSIEKDETGYYIQIRLGEAK